MKAIDAGIVASVGLDVYQKKPNIHPGLGCNRLEEPPPFLRFDRGQGYVDFQITFVNQWRLFGCLAGSIASCKAELCADVAWIAITLQNLDPGSCARALMASMATA